MRSGAVRTAGWWAMLLGAAAIVTTFSALFFSYFHLRFVAGEWPPGGIEPPDLGLPLAATVLFLAVSGPVHLGVTRMRRGSTGGLVLGTLGTVVLGGAAIALIALDLARAPFGVTTHAYGSLYFVVIVMYLGMAGTGVVMSLVTQLWAGLGYFDRERHAPVQVTALYWHLVILLWIPVFLTIYVSPHVV